MNYFIYFALFFSFGCASLFQTLDPKLFYKRDMEITVNGLKAEGVMVVPKAESYKFDIKSKGNLDLFTFTTCHREQTKERAGLKAWLIDKKRRKFNYKPTLIERDSLACAVHIGGFERKKGRHSWAFIDFEHEELTMPAKLSCNGGVKTFKGVSVCQSRAGLIQQISFTRPVLVAEKNTCIIIKAVDEKNFIFQIPKGRCSFRFVSKSGKEQWHRLTTLGYEKILIRED